MSESKQQPQDGKQKSRHGFWAGLCLGVVVGLVAGSVAISTVSAKVGGQWLGPGAHFHQRHGPPGPEVMKERTDFAIDWVLSRVDATTEQRDRVKAIASRTIEDLLPLAEHHRERGKAFAAELAKPTIDREAIESLRKAELELAEQASSRLIEALADAAETLTQEQRARLLELAERHHR